MYPLGIIISHTGEVFVVLCKKTECIVARKKYEKKRCAL